MPGRAHEPPRCLQAATGPGSPAEKPKLRVPSLRACKDGANGARSTWAAAQHRRQGTIRGGTLPGGRPARRVRCGSRPRFPTRCTSSLYEASSTMRVPPRELPHCFQSSNRVLDSTENARLCCSGVSRPPPPPLLHSTRVPPGKVLPAAILRPAKRNAARMAPLCGPQDMGAKGSRAACSLPSYQGPC